MQNITPALHQDQPHALQGAGTAAEAYPILIRHWPGFSEILAAERQRQSLSSRSAQHVVQVAGSDRWSEPQILVAGDVT